MINNYNDWRLNQKATILEMLGGHVDFPEIDHRLRFLFENFNCKSLTAVEFGCWHGWHTVQLARQFGSVLAVDVRPDNIAKALLRLNLLDIKNVVVKLADVNDLVFDCDVLIHLGVLYHLFNPVSHLHHVLPHCKVICLDTHIARKTMPASVEVYNGVVYRGGIFAEHGWVDMLSGVDTTSLWLVESDLLRIIDECGFDVIHTNRYEVATGERITLVAVRRYVLTV